jgi:hypothetical protein
MSHSQVFLSSFHQQGRRRKVTILPSQHTRDLATIHRASIQDLRMTRTGFLGVILCVGGALCFFAAYYLHISVTPINSISAPKLPVPTTSILRHDGARYLSYLPHSGLHNQRIALENALTLSILLNRTLLLPPARLGTTIKYAKYELLRERLARESKVSLAHCAAAHPNLLQPEECIAVERWTVVPWRWLTNLDSLHAQFVERLDMSDNWLHDTLGLSDNNIYAVPDTSQYHFRFIDVPAGKNLSEDVRRALAESHSFQHATTIRVADLASRSEQLISLGTLFGSSRLWLANSAHAQIRRRVRAAMAFRNAHIETVVDDIGKRMGTRWLGAHVRVGDGSFKVHAAENVRDVWERLITGMVIDGDTRRRLDELAFDSSTADLISMSQVHANTNCRGALHQEPHLAELNSPLYIATDTPNPESDPLLFPLFRTFPCTFVLADFSLPHPQSSLGDALSPLNSLINGYDRLKLRNFLLPIVDGMVVARSEIFEGTKGSTFSQFVEDVLVPTWKGLKIHERTNDTVMYK